MNSYELSRAYFDWSFDNPEHSNPTMTAIYFYIIDKNNRLGWKEKFNLRTNEAMECLGIKNYKSYTLNLAKLIEFGFIKMIQKSTNQNVSNIISLVNKKSKTNSSTLDKSTMTISDDLSDDDAKNNQSISDDLSDDLSDDISDDISDASIDKPLNNKTNKPINNKTINLISNEISDHQKNRKIFKSQKKEKKESSVKEKRDSTYQGMVVVWFKWFKSQFEISPKMTDRDGLVIKRISEYFSTELKNKNNYSDENLYESFRIILETTKNHKFVYENLSLSIIESKINELIAIARNPIQSKQNASTLSALEIVNRKTLANESRNL